MSNLEDQKSDEKNIGQRNADQVVNPLAKYEEGGSVDTAKYDQSDHSEYARQREANAAQGSPSGGWRDKTSEGAGANQPQGFGEKMKAAFSAMSGRKKGALGGIIVLVLGVMGIGGTLFAPGIGIVQMKEVLTSNLNDQLAAMDIRSDAVFRSKLKSISSGVCTGVQIKCKFSTMSSRQVTKFQTAFEKYGYSIPEDGIEKTAFGRQRIVKIVAPDGSTITNPAELVEARRTSTEVRAAMKRVYNPLYYGLSDKVANTFFANNSTDKQKKITGTDEEEQRKQLAQATSGEGANSGRGVVQFDESEKKNFVYDKDGHKIYEGDSNFEAEKTAAEQRIADMEGKSTPGVKATSGIMKTGAVGAVSVLGAIDTACSVYNLARAVSATAKVARSMQLVQFAMVVNTTADSIKAGDATQEEVEFMGNMLTATDTRETVFNEQTGEEEANPFYGKSAFDSPGYKTASYNDAPTLTPQSQQYMVGGGLSGSLSSVTDDIANAVTGGDKDQLSEKCGVIQSPWVRGVGLVAGIALSIGSFGIGTAVMAGASLAIAFAVPFLEAALSDIVAGNVIGENIEGVEAGDAYFAGSGALLGGIAQNRGMAPLSKDGIQSYLAATADTRSELIADAKAEASTNQFDVYNQYSFVGSLTRSLFPVVSQARTSTSSALLSVGSFLSTSVASLTTNASAAQEYNEERYSKCLDEGYLELGIDADIFCNVRYGLTSAELAMDTDVVVDTMLARGYITNSGEPVDGSEYDNFMQNCVNRENGWGETGEETTDSAGASGKKCIDGSGETYNDISYFRVYTMDLSISQGMDDEDNGAASQVTGDGSFKLPTNPGYEISSPFGPRDLDGRTFHKGVDITNFPGGSAGQPVFAIGDGEVVLVDIGNTSCTSGHKVANYNVNNPVHIKHDNGLMSVYLHMTAGSITVKTGDRVTAGQQIGAIGDCGQSYGAHLHFETSVENAEQQFKDIANTNGGNFRNPVDVMMLLGVDLQNGVYTSGQ